MTVLGKPVVAARNERSATLSIVAPDAKPAVATVTWKLRVALPPGASVPPAVAFARAEPRHHLAAGDLAEVVTGRVGHRGSVQADAARDEHGPRRQEVGERGAGRPSCPVFCTHRVRQRVPQIRRGGIDGLRRGDPRRIQVGGERHHPRLVGVAARREPDLRARLRVTEQVRRPEQIRVIAEVVLEARPARGDQHAGVRDRRVEDVRVRGRGRRWPRVDGVRQRGEGTDPPWIAAPSPVVPRSPSKATSPTVEVTGPDSGVWKPLSGIVTVACRRRSAARRTPTGCGSEQSDRRRRRRAPSRPCPHRSAPCRAARPPSSRYPRRPQRREP